MVRRSSSPACKRSIRPALARMRQPAAPRPTFTHAHACGLRSWQQPPPAPHLWVQGSRVSRPSRTPILPRCGRAAVKEPLHRELSSLPLHRLMTSSAAPPGPRLFHMPPPRELSSLPLQAHDFFCCSSRPFHMPAGAGWCRRGRVRERRSTGPFHMPAGSRARVGLGRVCHVLMSVSYRPGSTRRPLTLL